MIQQHFSSLEICYPLGAYYATEPNGTCRENRDPETSKARTRDKRCAEYPDFWVFDRFICSEDVTDG
jgi:hypothetical protein